MKTIFVLFLLFGFAHSALLTKDAGVLSGGKQQKQQQQQLFQNAVSVQDSSQLDPSVYSNMEVSVAKLKSILSNYDSRQSGESLLRRTTRLLDWPITHDSQTFAQEDGGGVHRAPSTSLFSSSSSSSSSRDPSRNKMRAFDPTKDVTANDCDVGRKEFNLYTTYPECFRLLGYAALDATNITCPRTNFSMQYNLPMGSCCVYNAQCASNICDRYSRSCSTTCETSLDCPDNSYCNQCKCVYSDYQCNNQNLCLLCPNYNGPVNDQVKANAHCRNDSTIYPLMSQITSAAPSANEFDNACNIGSMCLRHVANAMGILATPGCYKNTLFSNVNKSCDNSALAAREELLVGNLTYCVNNEFNMNCDAMISTVNNALQFFFASDATLCALMQSLGCCLGQMYRAAEIVGDTDTMTYFDYMAQYCSLSTKPCLYEPSNLGGGAIAGIVVGIVVAIAVLAASLIWCIRRRKEENRWREIRDEEFEIPPPAGQMAEGDANGQQGGGGGGGGTMGFPSAPMPLPPAAAFMPQELHAGEIEMKKMEEEPEDQHPPANVHQDESTANQI